MILTLKKDAQDKFLPLSDEKVRAALAACVETPRKVSGPTLSQCVLLTALQGANKAKKLTLEEIGL